MSHDHVMHMMKMNSSGSHMSHDIPHLVHQGMNEGNTHNTVDHNTMVVGGADHGVHQSIFVSEVSEMCNKNAHGMHGMSMTFHGGYCETILFESWTISSVGGLIGSIIGILIMAALYEGLKYYREYLFWKTYNALQYRSVTMANEKNVVAEDNRVAHMVGEVIHKQPPTMLSWMHSFQTFLHIVQIVLSYFLMLIFMTYNIWLCFAVVLGAAIGYFLFGWKKSVIVDVTEHCH